MYNIPGLIEGVTLALVLSAVQIGGHLVVEARRRFGDQMKVSSIVYRDPVVRAKTLLAEDYREARMSANIECQGIF